MTGMDPNFLISRTASLSHRHGNEWVQLERHDPHSPADIDPERHWAGDVIFACPRCDEQIRIAEEPSDPSMPPR